MKHNINTLNKALNEALTDPSPQEIIRDLEKARTLIMSAAGKVPAGKLSKKLTSAWKDINTLISDVNKGMK